MTKGGKKMDKMIIEGYLYSSESEYMVIHQDDEKSVLIDDTLLRSPFLGMRVRITIELVEE